MSEEVITNKIVYLSELQDSKDIRTCPKCAETVVYEVGRRYCTGDVKECDASAMVVDGDGQQAEHLHVSCKKCGYTRLARCADYKAPEPQQAEEQDKPPFEEVATPAKARAWTAPHLGGGVPIN